MFLEMTSDIRIVAVCVIVELQTKCYLIYVPPLWIIHQKMQFPSSSVSLGIAVNRKATVNFARSAAIEERVEHRACNRTQQKLIAEIRLTRSMFSLLL